MCISEREPEPPSTIKTNILLYNSVGPLLVNAVGSLINEAGNRSMIF